MLDLKQRKDRKKRSSRQRVFTNAHMVAEVQMAFAFSLDPKLCCALKKRVGVQPKAE